MPTIADQKSIEDLEKIAPGIINKMTELVLFEKKEPETYRKLSKGVREHLKRFLKEDFQVHVPLSVTDDPSPRFECYVMRGDNVFSSEKLTTYKFVINDLAVK